MSWVHNVTLEFIELYKQEQILWDQKFPSHKNRAYVTEAWERIQSKLSVKLSVEDLKKKKESLMTQYRLHAKKKKNTPGEHRISWFAFPLLDSFLGKIEHYHENVLGSSSHTDREYFEGSESYDTKVPISEIHFTPQNTSKSDKQYVIFQPRHSNRSTVYTRRQSEGTDTSTVKVQTDAAISTDESGLFGQLLAKKLRKLDEHQRDLAMHEIDNIMFRAKMRSKSAKSEQRHTKSPVFIMAQENNLQFEDENVYRDPIDPNDET